MGREETIIESIKSDTISLSKSLGLTPTVVSTGDEKQVALQRKLSEMAQGQFDDFDLLERGMARECAIASQEAILKPAPFKYSWHKCYVKTCKEQGSFKM